MKTEIYHHHDQEPIMADQEYQRLSREAARTSAAEELEAWQIGRDEAGLAQPKSGAPLQP
jgi:hypothetical protein